MFKLSLVVIGRRPLSIPLLGVTCLTILSACQVKEGEDTAPRQQAASTAAADFSQPSSVLRLAPLGRADILKAVAAAADAVTSTQPLPLDNKKLTGRTFELDLPFGCEGTSVGAWGTVEVDQLRKVLRISVRPERWTAETPVGKTARGQSFDTIEGFWLERPWTSAEACPKVDPALAPLADPSSAPPLAARTVAGNGFPRAPSATQTVALAQFFAPETSRTLQRKNRPYTFTGKIPPGEGSPVDSYRLKLTGRIVGYSDGQPIHCTGTEPTTAPVCVVAVEYTGVAFEDSGSDEILATWK